MKCLLISLCLLVTTCVEASVAIIGGGPAGLSAAIWAARLNLDPIVIAPPSPPSPPFLIENYPGFPEGIDRDEFLDLLKTHALNYGARFIEGKALSVSPEAPFEILLSDGNVVSADTVIVATGRAKKKLGLPREEEFAGRGVGFCALCEGPLYCHKTVVVTGEEGLEEAKLLARWADKVYLLSDTKETLPENIQVIPQAKVIELIGSSKEGLTHVVIEKTDGKKELIPTDGLFAALGFYPVTSFLNGLVALDASGYIAASEEGKTSLPGLFAAGDVMNPHYHQLILAAASGCRAILEIYENTPSRSSR